jgi:acyl-coenzyme A thioesterase PaaI-like protein
MSLTLPEGPRHHPGCMGCGADNPATLGLDVTFLSDHVRASVTFDDRHVGAPGHAHGGAVAAAFDDVLGQVLVVLDRPAVTASLTVEFLAPALLGRRLDLRASVERTDGRKLHLAGQMRDGEFLVAEARGLFLQISPSHWRRVPGCRPQDA